MADRVTNSIIVKGSVDELFDIWANFENFPHFMKNIKSVRKTSDTMSHWVMEGPLGKNLEWDAKTTMVERNKRIAWSSVDGDLKTSGQVTFNDLRNNSTEITVIMHYEPPGGALGQAVANLFSDPEKRLDEDLRNFKAYAEGMYERTAKKH
jgi:uncharacterized membrane protein